MMLADFLLGMVALALLLLPGWLAARAAQVPQPLVAGFIASVVVLLNLVLALNACGVALDFAHCGAAWLILTLGVGWSARKTLLVPRSAEFPLALVWRNHWPLLLVLVPAFLVVIYRASAQPLFGIDTIFRWNYLAQQMFARGNLGFYPPVSGADYELYSWPDGIAPVVSSLYLWCYGLAGATRATLTAPLVIAQFALLIAGVFALGRRMFSERAGIFACALVACSPVVAWATAMGQETGLTALALVALLLYLPRDRSEETIAAAAFAGMAAGLGALAREYGLALILLGLALAMVRRLSLRSLVIFAVTAALVTFPWYARNWVRTGNPLFSLDLAGLFPVNRVQAWMNQSYQAEFGWSQPPVPALRFLLVNCCVALLGGLAGALIFFRLARPLLAAIILFVVIWAASLGYTAAGFTTAIRVLSPALALGAVLGGAACARWIPANRYLAGASVALGLIALDASLRALTLPGTVYKIPLRDWLAAGGAVHEYHQRPVYQQIARVAGTQRILVLGPNALLTLQGARTLPLWSPEVDYLFDAHLAPNPIAHRLRAANIGYVLLNRGSPNERFLAHSAYFRDPGETLRVLWADGDMLFFQVGESK